MLFFDPRRPRQWHWRWLLPLALILTVWSLAGCGGGGGGGGGGPAAPVTVTGVVEDKTTQIKLGGYVVTVQGTALQGTTGTAATGTLGQFTITGVTPGNVNLVVTDTCGHTIGAAVPVTVGTGSPASVGTITVDLSSNPPAPCF